MTERRSAGKRLDCDECHKPSDRKLKPLTRWLGEGEGRVPLWSIRVCDECFEDLIKEGSTT